MLYGIVSNYAMGKNNSWYLMANKDLLFKIDCWVIECNLSLCGGGQGESLQFVLKLLKVGKT
jgi:hypothetical protein